MSEVAFLWGGGTKLICVLKHSVRVLNLKGVHCPNREIFVIEGD